MVIRIAITKGGGRHKEGLKTNHNPKNDSHQPSIHHPPRPGGAPGPDRPGPARAGKKIEKKQKQRQRIDKEINRLIREAIAESNRISGKKSREIFNKIYNFLMNYETINDEILNKARENFKNLELVSSKDWPLPSSMANNLETLNDLKDLGLFN